MYKDIKDFFNKNLKINIDKKIINELKMFRLGWVTKSDEYIEFMGSNLTGVHPIRFSSVDDDLLFRDIFLIEDITKLQKDFYTVPGVLKKYKIAGSVMYQLLIYVVRYLMFTNTLDKDSRITGMRELLYIIQYRMFSSLYYKYYKNYTVEEHIAITVYEKLSYKFILKRSNSWGDVFDHRVNNILDKKGSYYNKFSRYTTEDAIRIVSGIQTKIRANLGTIYNVLLEVKDNNDFITNEGLTYIGGENNEKQIKDVGGLKNTYINNIRQIKYNASDFIDRDIITITTDMFGATVNKDILYMYLKEMCNEKLHKKMKIKLKRYKNKKEPYDQILIDIMSINFEYLQRVNINISDRSKIPEAIVLIKNYWGSSKVNNENMNNIKKYLLDMVKVTTGRKTRWLLITLALSFIVYVFLRSMKK